MRIIRKNSEKSVAISFLGSRLVFIKMCLFLSLLTGCQLNSSTEEKGVGVTASERGDTINVTKYSVKSETSYALKDWRSFVANDATIFTPADWKSHNTDGTVVLMPANSVDGDESISFDRYVQDLPDANYDEVVQKLYHKSFLDYKIIEEDKLKKMELERGVAYEKNFELMKGQVAYKGYFLVYKNQAYLYKYSIVLTQSRLNNYDGNLMQDIAGNLSVDNADIFGGNNAIKKIIILE